MVLIILIFSLLQVQNSLERAYPGKFKISGNKLIWADGTVQIIDDAKDKSHKEMLENADIQDMFYYEYPVNFITEKLPKNYDPGRIRNTAFFENMYGKTKDEVEENLVEIIWLKSVNAEKLRITKLNGVAAKLQAISDELDSLSHLHKYLVNPGGTFNWRKIKNTDRMSAHSFGIAIDINVKHSDYWAWHSKYPLSKAKLGPPKQIVEIFEKYGFIWGGKWHHFDTMHFEYRPELLISE